MFGRICAIATFLPALLAAQEETRFHPYARADIGIARYLKSTSHPTPRMRSRTSKTTSSRLSSSRSPED